MVVTDEFTVNEPAPAPKVIVGLERVIVPSSACNETTDGGVKLSVPLSVSAPESDFAVKAPPFVLEIAPLIKRVPARVSAEKEPEEFKLSGQAIAMEFPAPLAVMLMLPGLTVPDVVIAAAAFVEKEPAVVRFALKVALPVEF